MLKSKTLLVLLLLMTAAAFAAPASSDGTQASAAEIKTSLRADLTLKHVVLMPEIAQPAAGPTVTATALKTCRCSCGQPCTTNADCGGNVCGVGITCCNRTPGANSKTAVNSAVQKEELSSRKNPSIAAGSDCQQQ